MNISHNHITSIPSIALNDLRGSLKHLDISNNHLTRISDNQFSSFSAIESINISNNALDSIAQFTFTDLKTLKTLDLSTNQLKIYDFLVEAAPIRSIYLENNKYRDINISAFKMAAIVYLKNNPWNCTWLLRALANKEHLVANIQFGFEMDYLKSENSMTSLAEEVQCFDYRQSLDEPTIQRFVIMHTDCDTLKNADNEKKVMAFKSIDF